MKKEKDKELDDLFNKGLGDPVGAGYREEDWNALEQMLDRSKKRKGIIFWLPILSTAAILLILFGWWVLQPQVSHNPKQKQQQFAMHQPGNNSPVSADMQNKPLAAGNSTGITKGQLAVSSSNSNGSSTGINNGNHIVKPAGALSANNSEHITPANNNAEAYQRPFAANLVAVNPYLSMGENDNKKGIDLADIKPDDILRKAATESSVKHNKEISKTGLFAHPQYALSVLGAPELNGVNSLQQTRSGTNLGMLFSVGLNKVTFSSGALYAIKPYNTYFNNYAGGVNSNLTSINADCRVLDIPLNVDYLFYNKHQNKFSIGSGLSSYIMLHESYQYNYTNPAVNGPVNYTVPNTNKYLFGILNLQATYTRQLTSNVGFSIQPYMKLPLTGIGANNAKLQTEGVAIGLRWNLNSLSKP